MLVTWWATVRRLNTSSSAMAWLLLPKAMRRSTSTSRSLRLSYIYGLAVFISLALAPQVPTLCRGKFTISLLNYLTKFVNILGVYFRQYISFIRLYFKDLAAHTNNNGMPCQK